MSGPREPDSTTETKLSMHPPVTLRSLRKVADGGEKFACLTCYDYTTATWLEQAGVPVLLAGDSAADVILGLPGTIHAPLEFMLTITAAVKRGAPRCLVMADMPFMSYQADIAEGIRNAGRFMTHGRADCVKFEVDARDASLVDRAARAGIPVIAHIGSRPQLAKHQGGYSAAGRTVAEANALITDAAVLEEAGATMILIEAVPAEVAREVVERTTIPVIGCGAGTACHGQIVVLQDLLGLSRWQPSFAQPIAALGAQITTTAESWITRVAHSDLGTHPYTMHAGETLSSPPVKTP